MVHSLMHVGCGSHQHRRDLPDHRWHLLCGGPWFCEAESVQLKDGDGLTGGDTHIPGSGQAAGGEGRPDWPWKVLQVKGWGVGVMVRCEAKVV